MPHLVMAPAKRAAETPEGHGIRSIRSSSSKCFRLRAARDGTSQDRERKPVLYTSSDVRIYRGKP